MNPLRRLFTRPAPVATNEREWGEERPYVTIVPRVYDWAEHEDFA